MEIKFSGFGGQGIIRMGLVLGRAASIFDNKHATLTQSFGPEARGGACSAQLIVSEQRILYPYLTQPDILVTMSQEAYDKFEHNLKEDGILLIEKDLVRPHPPRKKIRQYTVLATRIGEEMGNRIFANMVMLGFMDAVTKIVPQEALRKALPGMVPDRFIKTNLVAMEKGYELGLEKLSHSPQT
ncbi:pyruvate ferredoxin oxidoreductase [candidate division WOR-3 bacterium JGI_Cruoil_03_51_56]|uniref:Pyruvate ferredoxin oxidoreductase n=1 Tax=candidate division WOR-3 bacterium JGI_Cruoil_03_51_56 TaxID=1973747 RepID=A0A235BNA9_UNCW3|nr:MAG: pyruvate ferredoxin oxidoreductase [candidate division WOR-3 bacterium JGI_Cruoil_03_51_56]